MSQLHASHIASYASPAPHLDTSFLPRCIAEDYAAAMARYDDAEQELTCLLAGVTLCGLGMLLIALFR